MSSRALRIRFVHARTAFELVRIPSDADAFRGSRKPTGLGMVSTLRRSFVWPCRRCIQAWAWNSGSLENGGADMLLMIRNTRSGGVGQGRASFARRASGRSAAQSLDGRRSAGYIGHERPGPVFSASSRAVTVAFTQNTL